MPDITCSQKDAGWSLTLPQIGASDQQNAETRFVSDKEFTEIFFFDIGSRTLTLDPAFESELVKGNFCPAFDKEVLKFST